MPFPAIWRSKCIFQQSGDPSDFANSKKLNFWEKTAVDKSAWIRACYYISDLLLTFKKH